MSPRASQASDTEKMRVLSKMPSLSDISRHLRVAAVEIDGLRRERLDLRAMLSRMVMLWESVDQPFAAHEDANDLLGILIEDARRALDGDLS